MKTSLIVLFLFFSTFVGFNIAQTTLTYPIVDTMQDKCFDNNKEISAPKVGETFYGQDAQFLGNQATYTKSKDSLTVLDNVTSLIWQSSPDTNFDGSLTATDKLTWEKAQGQAKILSSKNFGGYNDWRLPSIKELYSLIDFRGTDPSGPDSASPKPFIDTNYFTFLYGDTSKGERIIDSQYASSNLYTGQAMNSEGGKLFGVNFADGRIKGYGLKMPSRPPGPGGGDKTFFVLCVRGNPKYGINQLVNNQYQTITDQATGLMWSKSDNSKGLNWQEALAWVQTKNKENYLGHNDWRLPNAKELQSIVDYGRNPDATDSPAIDPLFSCTQINNEVGQKDYPWYWTGTTHISANGMGGAAIYLCFGRATGYMNGWADVHGAGAQRSDPKSGDPSQFPKGRGPQGDGIRIYNHVRLVRDQSTKSPEKYVDFSFDGNIVLGSPTNSQVTANITANQTAQVSLGWGEKTNEYNQKSNNMEASNLKPAVIVMNNLQPNKTYYYRLFFKTATDKEFKTTKEYTFQAPRSLGASYSFVVQSDSHLLNKADKEIYAKSMQTMAEFKPDFLLDLGDTFINDQSANPCYQPYENIRQTSFQQRSYLDSVTRSAYLFLTIGNHEGEYGYYKDGTDKNLTVMSTLARKTYYPNPEPDEFYSGNTTKEDFVGLPQNYYAFQWGDALYVCLDYYRYMTTLERNPIKAGWNWTLGKTQYDWFRKTLETSTAKYKFVFAHHSNGLSVGGSSFARLFEWGGYEINGKYLFDQKRPGWGKPIQQVMKDAGVTIFFQGHDHLFAREMVDSVVYQTIPKPAEKIGESLTAFGVYPKADILLNSGFIKVDVSPANVRVSYFRNYFVSTDPQEGNTGIVFSYTVDSNHQVKVTLPKKDDVRKYKKK